MKDVWNWIQGVIAIAGGFFGWFLGGLDGFLYALIAFVVIDYLTGIMCAIVTKSCPATWGSRGCSERYSSS